jgi:hypothetical protein
MWEEQYTQQTGRPARLGEWYSADYVRWLERLLDGQAEGGEPAKDAVFVALGRAGS